MSPREPRKMNEKNARCASWLEATMLLPSGGFMRRLVVESWADRTPQEIALRLDCHPQTVRIHLNRFNAEGINGLGMREGAGRKPRLTEQERERDPRPGEATASWEITAV